MRLRRMLYGRFKELIPRYNEAVIALKPMTEQLDLEKFYDIYDISDLDLQEAALAFDDSEFEDKESLRVLKILAARLHTIRKVFLCCLLALDADGGKADFSRWTTASEELEGTAATTGMAEERLRKILEAEEGTFSLCILTITSKFISLTRTPNSKDSFDSGTRKMACSASKIEYTFKWYSWSSSKITCTS